MCFCSRLLSPSCRDVPKRTWIKILVRSVCANGAAFLFLLSALWRWLDDYGTVCPAGRLLDEKRKLFAFVSDIAIIVVSADVAVSD